MSNYYNADIKLSDLLVNRENYRFHSVKDEHEAMLTMLEAQQGKITRLAENIAKHGLNPTRRLPVLDVGGGKYVVLEGNRRITALKLMTNPSELPGQYTYKPAFQKLHATYKTSLPTAVECVVYPEDERDLAELWVGLEHTGENQGVGTVTWTTRQQERFDNRRNKKPSRAFQVLEFLDTKKVDTSEVKQTNLDRLLSTPAVLGQLGIDFPGNQLMLKEPEPEVIAKFKKVIDHMSASGFAVRQIYHADQRVDWIGKVIAPAPSAPQPPHTTPTLPPSSSNGNTTAPAPSSSPNPTPASSLNVNTKTSQATALSGNTNTPAPQPSSAATPVPASNSSNTYQTLVNPANPLPVTSSTKIVAVYKELQTVNLFGQRTAAPHAVGALLRILVEITAQEYLIKMQRFRYDKNNSINFRNPADSKTYNDLPQKLNYIVNSCGLPGNIAQALRVLTADQLLNPTLNQVMHSAIFTASSTSIKELWKNFEKVFDLLITEMK